LLGYYANVDGSPRVTYYRTVLKDGKAFEVIAVSELWKDVVTVELYLRSDGRLEPFRRDKNRIASEGVYRMQHTMLSRRTVESSELLDHSPREPFLVLKWPIEESTWKYEVKRVTGETEQTTQTILKAGFSETINGRAYGPCYRRRTRTQTVPKRMVTVVEGTRCHGVGITSLLTLDDKGALVWESTLQRISKTIPPEIMALRSGGATKP
jgi:hypothetical protein